MRHKFAGAVIGAATVASSIAGVAHANSDVEKVVSVIVALAEGANPSDVVAASRGKLLATHDNVNTVVLEMRSDEIESLSHDANVSSVSIDSEVSVADTQDSAPWNLDRLDQASLPLDSTYTFADGATGVTVYVVDTGLRATHTEFQGRVADGFDGVGDGRGTDDCNGHGTFVSGIASGSFYGVAKGATLVPVRVLGCDGFGTWSQVIAGLDWVVANHQAGVPAVLNLSLRGDANDAADAAVQRVINDGIVVAAAAGNDGADACSYSPSRVPDVITVAATQPDDGFASFSNSGTCVDLFAPGVEVSSSYNRSDSDAVVLSGTSMSSPLVAGAAALAFARDRRATVNSVVSMLKLWSTPNIVVGVPMGTPNFMLYVPPTGYKVMSTANVARRK